MYIQITTSLPFSMTFFICYQIVFCYLAVFIKATPLVDFQCPIESQHMNTAMGRYSYLTPPPSIVLLYNVLIENPNSEE